MSAQANPTRNSPNSGSEFLRSIALTALLAGMVGCGAATDLTGGNTNLNLTSPYAEINLAIPSNLPVPGAGDGAGGIASGANFELAAGGENVTVLSSRGRFKPNWGKNTLPAQAHLAWATYWLDMADTGQATALVLDWLEQPQATDIWVGLANWDKDLWIWRKLTVVDTLTPPTLNPFIRSSDQMLACTILILGTQHATLTELRTDIGTGAPPPAGLLNLDAHLGVNLGGVTDFSPTSVFVDVFKTSRTWTPQDVVGGPWDNGHAINVDSDGWVTSLDPGQAVAAVMMTDTVGVYPAGEYICLYDGQGTIEFLLHGAIAWSTPGRLGVTIDGGGIVNLRITSTVPGDYIRNIRLIMPGFEGIYQTQPFHPDFLQSLAGFNVLRFMDWGTTNYSAVQTWADRTTLTSSTQTPSDAGVCLELMVDLSNTSLTDAWICIPYLADDDYVRNAAILIRDRLNPQLRVFMEYSNEVWNGLFPAASYASSQGLALGLSTNSFEAQLRFYSQRSQEVHTIFSEVFVGQTDRLVRVAAGQSTNPWVGTTIMDWDAALGSTSSASVSQRFDHYATAPYFGGYLGVLPQANITVNMSLTDLLSACNTDSLASNGLGGFTESNSLNATSRGISLISYEGGQHLVGVGAAKDDVNLTNLFIAANRDMGMRQIYTDDLRRWSTSGGGLFVAFSHIDLYTKHGSWGLLESQTQDTATAPKWLGLMDWLGEVTAAAQQ